MSYRVIAFTADGIWVADGALAAQRAIELAGSGNAATFVVKHANDAAPAVDIILNGKTVGEFAGAVTSGNASAATKTAFAAALGTMAALGATPFLGPAGAMAFGEGKNGVRSFIIRNS